MITVRLGKRQSHTISFYSKILFKTILFIGLLWVLYFFSHQIKSYFPIKTVQVFGAEHLNQQLLQENLIPLVRKGFFGIDVEAIKETLLISPWVAGASVQRIWPDQVRIIVKEKIPVARWNENTLLSNNGELFSPDPTTYPNHLPLFRGEQGQQYQILQYYKKLNGVLSALHFKIAQLELNSESSWNLTLENGIKLNVGEKEILTRVSHFVKVYPKIIGNRTAKVDYVDLRYPNGLAVRWKTVT